MLSDAFLHCGVYTDLLAGRRSSLPSLIDHHVDDIVIASYQHLIDTVS